MPKSDREARKELYELDEELKEEEGEEVAKKTKQLSPRDEEPRRRPGDTEEWTSEFNPDLHFTFIMPGATAFRRLARDRETVLGDQIVVKPKHVEPLMRDYVRPDPFDKPHGIEMTPLEWEELVIAFWSFCFS